MEFIIVIAIITKEIIIIIIPLQLAIEASFLHHIHQGEVEIIREEKFHCKIHTSFLLINFSSCDLNLMETQ